MGAVVALQAIQQQSLLQASAAPQVIAPLVTCAYNPTKLWSSSHQHFLKVQVSLSDCEVFIKATSAQQ